MEVTHTPPSPPSHSLEMESSFPQPKIKTKVLISYFFFLYSGSFFSTVSFLPQKRNEFLFLSIIFPQSRKNINFVSNILFLVLNPLSGFKVAQKGTGKCSMTLKDLGISSKSMINLFFNHVVRESQKLDQISAIIIGLLANPGSSTFAFDHNNNVVF